jgi:hypothetical protein
MEYPIIMKIEKHPVLPHPVFPTTLDTSRVIEISNAAVNILHTYKTLISLFISVLLFINKIQMVEFIIFNKKKPMSHMAY